MTTPSVKAGRRPLFSTAIVPVALKRLGLVLVAAVIAIVLWIVVLAVFDVNPLIGARPWQVWSYLVTDDDAAAHVDTLGTALGVTLRDTAIGYVVGIIAAATIAIVFVLSRVVEDALMPIMLVVRTMPLVVLTPLITFMLGNGLGSVIVVIVLVVFFPAVVMIVEGLRSASPQLVDYVRVYRGSRVTLLRTVLLPSAVPALFAAARLTVPAAAAGALIAEWLATGDGLGGLISRSAGAFAYTQMWSAAVIATAVTMFAYAVMSVIDAIVVGRFSPETAH